MTLRILYREHLLSSGEITRETFFSYFDFTFQLSILWVSSLSLLYFKYRFLNFSLLEFKSHFPFLYDFCFQLICSIIVFFVFLYTQIHTKIYYISKIFRYMLFLLVVSGFCMSFYIPSTFILIFLSFRWLFEK